MLRAASVMLTLSDGVELWAELEVVGEPAGATRLSRSTVRLVPVSMLPVSLP
jgi:hypothetical protein